LLFYIGIKPARKPVAEQIPVLEPLPAKLLSHFPPDNVE
jgi:hypothetical protein